jgi:hypothetical protein
MTYIQNCWKHSQLLDSFEAQGPMPAPTNYKEPIFPVEELEELDTLIGELNIAKNDRISSRDFIQLDNEGEEEFDEDKELEELFGEPAHDDPTEPEYEISLDQKIVSLSTVLGFVGTVPEMDEVCLKMRTLLNELKYQKIQTLRQSSITSFFTATS